MAADIAAARQLGDAPAKATLTDWLAVIAGIMGAFMAALDISVTNASLAQIQGELGATGSEGSWIATGYLAAEIVMIPLTAWFVRVLGLRTFLLLMVAGFTFFSVGCGISTSLRELILWRVGQGFTGGAMIPTAMTIVTLRLPPAQRPIGFAVFGLTAVISPLFGPLVGGWLTDNINWHYIFFLNLPVGAALITLLLIGLPHQVSRLSEFGRADFVGIAGLILGLGGLTIMLEEGQREQWFESHLVVGTAIAAALGALLTAISQATNPRPVIKLKLVLNRGFGGAFVVSLVVGAVLYALPYIIPVFLGGLAGYSAEATGKVVLISGIPSILLLPMMPFLVRKIDLRWLAAAGLLVLALSCLTNAGMTLDTGGDQLVIPQLLRGLGQALVMTPLGQASTASVALEDAGDASGLFNMARNLGGSLGLALTATLIDVRSAFHAAEISQSLTANNPAGQAFVSQLGAGATASSGDPSAGIHAGLQQLAQIIQGQALVMTYADCFFVLGVALLVVLPLVMLLRPLSAGATLSTESH